MGGRMDVVHPHKGTRVSREQEHSADSCYNAWELKHTALSERRQTQKATWCDPTTSTWKTGKQAETEGTSASASGWGREGLRGG